MGSADSANDVLDARVSDDFKFGYDRMKPNTISIESVDSDGDADGKGNAELSEVDYIMVSDTDTDVDFYKDMSHLNGKRLIDGLGDGAVDAYGEGYDVITSAQVNEFGDAKALRVYYEGDHGDFVDTDDDMTYSDGIFTMSTGDTTNGSGWEDDIASGQYGAGQEPGFYVEISEKKVAVTFDAEKNAWKVDSSALQVAENADTIDMTAIMNSDKFAEDVMARFGLKPAAP